MLPILIIMGLGYIALKQARTVSAPTPGSRREMAANVLPSNFADWILTASPRQKDAVRQILIYQLRRFRPDLSPDPRRWPPMEDYPAVLVLGDPANFTDAYVEADSMYRHRFGLPPGPPAQ